MSRMPPQFKKGEDAKDKAKGKEGSRKEEKGESRAEAKREGDKAKGKGSVTLEKRGMPAGLKKEVAKLPVKGKK